MKTDFKNILVIQTAFIGDAILASSVLEKLHSSFPEAKISLLVKKGNESLYESHPFLDQVFLFDYDGAGNLYIVKPDANGNY